MATIYSLNDLGRVFDCTLPSTITPGEVLSQKIIFYKPDGTRFEKVATRASDVITYDNSSPDETILDARGDWEYTAQVELANAPTPDDTFEVPQRNIFWVK